ncbi:MAG TPA: Gfo/Idh/MocA family oxidoreductase [Microlunatus sp.]
MYTAKTQAFATEHGIATVHTDSSALIADAHVDVVYIATPHPLHHDLALAAIAAGKHVLIEKPIAMSADEARAITDAGRAAGAMTSTGVDARADLLLPAAAGATAIASTSMVTSMPITASIQGTSGRLEVLSPFFAPSGLALTVGSIGSEESVTWPDDSLTLHEGLGYQATHFASYDADGRLESPVHDHPETVSVMATINEARRQVAAAGHLFA